MIIKLLLLATLSGAIGGYGGTWLYNLVSDRCERCGNETEPIRTHRNGLVDRYRAWRSWCRERRHRLERATTNARLMVAGGAAEGMMKKGHHSQAARLYTVSARVDAATDAALNRAAKKLKVSRSQLIAETLAAAMGENRTCAMS